MSDEEITAEVEAPHGGDSTLCRELTVVDTVDATPIKTAPFELPEGWTVCDDGTREYKVYYEPGTGRRFESLGAVERHLEGADCGPSPEASELGSCFEKHYERRKRRKVLPLIADDKYFPRFERKSSSKALKVRNDARSSSVRKSIVSGGKILKLDNKKLVVEPNAKAIDSPFNLPDGWVVEEVPRRNTTNKYSDKYFYEPGTGKKFRTLASVKRHLAETEEGKPLAAMFNIGSHTKSSPGRKSNASVGKRPRARKSIVSGGKMNMQLPKLDNRKKIISPQAESRVSCLDLPDGWLVKEVPRRITTNGFADKYYYEPGTGEKFRSLSSVKRHLAEAEEDKPLAVMFGIESPAKKRDLKNKNSREKLSYSTFEPATPPAKIKWVLTDDNSGECTFKPFIGEAMVAEPLVQQWANRFMILINGENHIER